MITVSIIKEVSECFSFIYVYITNAKLTELSIKAFSHISYLTEIDQARIRGTKSSLKYELKGFVNLHSIKSKRFEGVYWKH